MNDYKQRPGESWTAFQRRLMENDWTISGTPAGQVQPPKEDPLKGEKFHEEDKDLNRWNTEEYKQKNGF